MKKIATILLSFCMLLVGGITLAGCGHEHVFQTEWSNDLSHHWHKCEQCEEKQDIAEHDWTNWTTVDDSTHTRNCETCGTTITEDHNWNGGSVTKFPTATTAGERTFVCVSCSKTKTEPIEATANFEPTKSDLQTLLKSVAQNIWTILGAGNPAEDVSQMSINLPTTFTEVTNATELKSLKANASALTALIYMAGEYYGNEDFIVSNHAVTFIANSTRLSSEGPVEVEITLLPTLDIANNKISLEIMTYLLDETTMYHNFEIDYDFVGTNGVTAFHILSVQDKIDYIEIKMENQKYYTVETFTAQQKAAANQMQADFKTKKTQGQSLYDGNFSGEFDNYCIVASNAYQSIMGGTTPSGPSGPQN